MFLRECGQVHLEFSGCRDFSRFGEFSSFVLLRTFMPYLVGVNRIKYGILVLVLFQFWPLLLNLLIVYLASFERRGTLSTLNLKLNYFFTVGGS